MKGFEAGAGGVVTKTITYDVNMQIQPKPRMYVVDKHGAIARTKFYSFYSVDLMSEYPQRNGLKFLEKLRMRSLGGNLKELL